jgi:ribosomal protein L24
LQKDAKITIHRGAFMNKEAKVIRVLNKKVQVIIESIGFSLVALIDKSNVAVNGK